MQETMQEAMLKLEAILELNLMQKATLDAVNVKRYSISMNIFFLVYILIKC